MKLLRVLLFLLAFIIPAFSHPNPDYIEVKFIEKILVDMADRQSVDVCVVNYDVNKVLNYSTYLRITKCENADFMIIGKDSGEVDYNKPAIVFGEDLIRKVKNAVGAIYWRKGRLQLIFIKGRLDRYRIQLPGEYRRYLIDEFVLSKVSNSLLNIKDIYFANIKDIYFAWNR
jgi:hypothetical protein